MGRETIETLARSFRRDFIGALIQSGASAVEATRAFQRAYVVEALRQANWNESRAAAAIGMHRNTLRHWTPPDIMEIAKRQRAENARAKRMEVRA